MYYVYLENVILLGKYAIMFIWKMSIFLDPICIMFIGKCYTFREICIMFIWKMLYI